MAKPPMKSVSAPKDHSQNRFSLQSLRAGAFARVPTIDCTKRFYCAAGVILCLAFGIRLIGLDKGIWLDEYVSLHTTLSGDLRHTLTLLRSYDNQPPLYFLLLKLWSHVGGGERVLRLPSVFLSMGTVAIVVAWLKGYSRLSSVLAGLLIVSLPIFLRYSHEIRNYALFVFAVALSFFFASRVAHYPEKLSSYLGLAFGLLLTVSSHLVGVMVLIPVAAFIFLSISDKKQIDWRMVGLALALSCALFAFYGFVYLEGLGRRTEDWWMPPFSIDLVSSTIEYMIGLSSTVQPLTLSHGGFLDSTWLAGRTCGLLLLALIVLSSTLGNWRRSYPFLVAVLLFGLQIVAYSMLKTPIFWPRTLLPGVVPLVGFVGLQVATIRLRQVKIAGIIALLILSLIYTASWITGGAQRPVEAWRGASELLRSRWQPGDLVVFYPNYIEGPVGYYFAEPGSDASISVAIGADIKHFDEAISAKLSKAVQDRDRPVVFLVVRGDLSVQKDLGTYHTLVSVLQSKRDELSSLQAILITCSDVEIEKDLVETRLELLAGLESWFGAPASFQDFGSFALSEHESMTPD